ncbi:unnamed protein product [Chrysoparadoxa australica]
MGKGGERVVGEPRKVSAAGKVSAAELGNLSGIEILAQAPTEELRKRAELLGLPAAGEREELLNELRPFADGMMHRWQPPRPLPLHKPTMTYTDVMKAIPRHCFERSFAKSMVHLISDLALISALGYAASWISHPAVPEWAGFLLWPLYWFAQGTVMTGVWVLAHECGHQAFSNSETANNIVGLICHSALLVPYHSWRITHAKHHANTGSCENDEVFCPPTRESKQIPVQEPGHDMAQEMAHESPLVQAFFIVVMLLVGWMPGYLVFNCTGPRKYHGKSISHFNPWAAMFEERDRMDIVVSDLGFFAALAGLCYAISTLGFATVGAFYLAPFLITNGYLVLITYLQHTDVFMPHFRGDEWNWFRGALCTVDRSFGAIIDHTIHHIADTHVCHHLFHKMPFYHAQEATEAIKGVLGDYYLADSTSIPKALWRSYTCCKFIEDDGGIVFYKKQ